MSLPGSIYFDIHLCLGTQYVISSYNLSVYSQRLNSETYMLSKFSGILTMIILHESFFSIQLYQCHSFYLINSYLILFNFLFFPLGLLLILLAASTATPFSNLQIYWPAVLLCWLVKDGRL